MEDIGLNFLISVLKEHGPAWFVNLLLLSAIAKLWLTTRDQNSKHESNYEQLRSDAREDRKQCREDRKHCEEEQRRIRYEHREERRDWSRTIERIIEDNRNSDTNNLGKLMDYMSDKFGKDRNGKP